MWQGVLNKVFKAREKIAAKLDPKDEEKPFLDHLEDLRTMLVRMMTTLLLSLLVTFVFYKELFRMIQYPLILAGLAKDEAAAQLLLQNTDVAGPFMMAVNVSLIAAVIIAFPLLFIFLLQFILPGLRPNEKKLLFPAIAIGTGLFVGGCFFAYHEVLPRALEFFAKFAATVGSRQDWTLSSYITFATRFVLVFGVAFELPVVVMALVKLGILGFKMMIKTWRHALVAITLFAAIITPTPDVVTLLLMSGPLYFLYAVCVILAYFIEKKDREAFPDYYAQLEKDEQELAAPATPDEWDNDQYQPWYSDGDSTGEDQEDEYAKARPSAPPPQVEKAPGSVPLDGGDSQASTTPTSDEPEREKTTEELAREDEQSGGNRPLA